MSGTLFKEVNYTLASLMDQIELGVIGLPDIQRPFVWPNAKIRDLFDSMYRGYPIGYLLFWQNGLNGGNKGIGTDKKQKPTELLIVDGQQRLTSLYAVVKGVPVVRENYAPEHVEIAFNPLSESFEVTEAFIRKDRSYIPSISKVWDSGSDLFEIVENYLDHLKISRSVSPDDEKRIKKAITRLHSMLSFPFTALELSASIDEEQVAEVFVRINSKGKPLNQADFILTLMSVFWDEGRTQLECFCRDARNVPKGKPSPFNYYFEPDPDQLLRVSVGLGFRRARLKHVYSILRGKDLETHEFSEKRRENQFQVLKQAQERTLNLLYWHDFWKAIRQSGHLGKQTISSQAAIVFAYTLYLIGRTEFKVDEPELRRVIARWFFMSTLSARYSNSPESKMESDLGRLRTAQTPQEFVAVLDRVCDETFTEDYWEFSLPGDMSVSSTWSPAFFAYCAALVILNARVLYSNQGVKELLDPAIKGPKAAIEKHHLFPKAFLIRLGMTKRSETNQMANLALVEWGDNLNISDKAPENYIPHYEAKFPEEEIDQFYYWHALPRNWHALSYSEFLGKRRELMAQVIADGFAKLAPKSRPVAIQTSLEPEALIGQGETRETEFKGTLRTSLHTHAPDERITWGVLRTIAGFLNQSGGTLVVGVLDDGKPVGYKADGFESEEEAVAYLTELLTERLRPEHLGDIHPRFEDYKGVRILVIECWPAKTPAYLEHEGRRVLYVREGTTTVDVPREQEAAFVRSRFGSGAEPLKAPLAAGDVSKSERARIRKDARKRFWTQLLYKAKERTPLHETSSPVSRNCIGVSSNGMKLKYLIRGHDAHVELYIDFGTGSREKNKDLFDQLYVERSDIEAAFGEPLEWERLDQYRACRIKKVVKGGGWRDEPAWPEVQDRLIDAMIRLEKAFRPHFDRLLAEQPR